MQLEIMAGHEDPTRSVEPITTMPYNMTLPSVMVGRAMTMLVGQGVWSTQKE